MTRVTASLAETGASRERAARPLAVSVAVCTRGRPAALHRALASLAAQIVPAAEVLVVDNSPGDPATRAAAEAFPFVRYELEPREGLDFARNRALALAHHDIVAFLDDDVVADTDWILELWRAFRENPGAVVCNGWVGALSLDAPGQRLFEANGGFGRGVEPIHLNGKARERRWDRRPLISWSNSVGSGCNMAVRRRRVLALGGFDDALDLGRALPGGGDLDLYWRVLREGGELIYEPRVRARHEHRRDEREAAAQIAGHNRALVAVLVKAALQARGRQRLEVLAFLGWRLVKPWTRLLRRGLGRDPLPARVLVLIGWHTWVGLGSYPLAVRTARRRRVRAG